MRRVLIVEDYEDARSLIGLILEGAGYRVLSASDGLEGVELARKFHPDAIVMDLFMPVMDGVEATRRIKALPETCDVPVIAYTARPDPLENDLFDAICHKPCQPEILIGAVRGVLAAEWRGRRL
jgi:CheY-like chemotaxis protein